MTMRNKQMTRAEKIRYCAIARWAIYVFMIFVSVIIINIGNGVKPLLLIPLCTCICMNEGEYTAAVLGGICGLLIDFSCGKFFGYSCIFMIAFCVATVLFFKHYLLQNVLNIVWLTAMFTAVYELFDYFFFYAMWNYEGTGYVFREKCIPCVIYTTIAAPFVWLLIKPVLKRFYPKRAKTIEEAMKI